MHRKARKTEVPREKSLARLEMDGNKNQISNSLSRYAHFIKADRVTGLFLQKNNTIVKRVFWYVAFPLSYFFNLETPGYILCSLYINLHEGRKIKEVSLAAVKGPLKI